MKLTTKQFEDRYSSSVTAHLKKISGAMWRSGAERVSIMVGAGMSLNSIRVNPRKWLSTWKALSEKMARQLCPSESDCDALIKSSGDIAEGYMRIAQYYESMFGRLELERFVVDEISDAEFEPSELHQMLLELPWREIFTTNWDTLLERAADKLERKNFFPVTHDSDLLTAGRPRITKLHGCVSKNSSVTFTEEDYRSYPIKHPAFITTVRQALLEGPLCLVGFSGDDPNFLAWIGWIRDVFNAGNHVYLLKLDGTSFADYRLNRYAALGVTVVDLVPALSDHKPAVLLEQFFNYLSESGKRSWPQVIWGSNPVAIVEHYPGWLVCPVEYRNMLRSSPALKVEQSGASFETQAARMRMRKIIGTGPYTHEMKVVDELIASISDLSEKEKKRQRVSILELLTLRMEEASLALNSPEFENCLSLIKVFDRADRASDSIELIQVVYLLKLFRFAEAHARLENFKSDDPAIQLRALVLRFEQWPNTDIEADLRRLQTQIRRLLRANPDSEEFESLSVCAALLQFNLKSYLANQSRDMDDLISARLKRASIKNQRVRALECDVENELYVLGISISGVIEAPDAQREKTGFAPFDFRSIRYLKTEPKEAMVNAYLMARVWDDAGLYVYDVKKLARAAKWLLKFDPEHGVALLARLAALGAFNEIKALLTREIVTSLPKDKARIVWNAAITAIEPVAGRDPFMVGPQLHALVLLLNLIILLDANDAKRQFETLFFLYLWCRSRRVDVEFDVLVGLKDAARVVDFAWLDKRLQELTIKAMDASELTEARALEAIWDPFFAAEFPASTAKNNPQLLTKFQEILGSSYDEMRLRAFHLSLVIESFGLLSDQLKQRISAAIWGNSHNIDGGNGFAARFSIGWVENARDYFSKRILEADSDSDILKFSKLLTQTIETNTCMPEIIDGVLNRILLSIKKIAEQKPNRYYDNATSSIIDWKSVFCFLLIKFYPTLVKKIIDLNNPETWPNRINSSVAAYLYIANLIDEKILLMRFDRSDLSDLTEACYTVLSNPEKISDNVAKVAARILTQQFDEQGSTQVRSMLFAKRLVTDGHMKDSMVIDEWLRDSAVYSRNALARPNSNLRYASAILFVEITKTFLDRKKNIGYESTIQSFRDDLLPEVRNLVADS